MLMMKSLGSQCQEIQLGAGSLTEARPEGCSQVDRQRGVSVKSTDTKTLNSKNHQKLELSITFNMYLKKSSF